MGNLDTLLNQEYEKYLAWITAARRGDKRWIEVDQTGAQIDVTSSNLAAFEATAQSLLKALRNLNDDPDQSRPTKDWHFG
ncbi:hypothetical protein [Rhizobium mesoamericanum]|uniref:hypothetical protein n=1 Tax=Rhizobium mesoamericanum TaxID=1079800 RepID=UPI00048F68A0|nr:hypothetical protein [Rhizobium mesoamericanum]